MLEFLHCVEQDERRHMKDGLIRALAGRKGILLWHVLCRTPFAFLSAIKEKEDIYRFLWLDMSEPCWNFTVHLS